MRRSASSTSSRTAHAHPCVRSDSRVAAMARSARARSSALRRSAAAAAWARSRATRSRWAANPRAAVLRRTAACSRS
ncbi:MAG: hypothetical protein COT28_06235 [Methylobacterium sp. CG08_land_8_20_14_0_20_71_15]|nr:hypothetical protein [Methylorubrum sp. DB1722]PIU04641.1 MAG: hypothetical protein COT56_19095 [Methylobacterium sp. CG09_land_8_20_14_0_10_71_15]PIU14978.1 MAG: hypothetical protein COT28_06235 [Methylobacterium sp. CG08_land_8_20_14_0_20_71_15]